MFQIHLLNGCIHLKAKYRKKGKKEKSLSHVQFFVTPWTVAHQAPPSMEFSRQEYGVDCHFLLQGIFLTRGRTWVSYIIGRCFTIRSTREAQCKYRKATHNFFLIDYIFSPKTCSFLRVLEWKVPGEKDLLQWVCSDFNVNKFLALWIHFLESGQFWISEPLNREGGVYN